MSQPTDDRSQVLSEIAHRRRTTRAFLDTPVSNDQISEFLSTAARAPSGGNIQPWKIYVLNGPSMARFRSYIAERDFEPPAYAVYPQPLGEPYRTARFELGEQMYATIGIPREDRAARLVQLAKNYEFFDAPATIFCFVDRQMGPPQWSDLGMFLQTFMLAAAAAGMDTCPQESWASFSHAVGDFVGAGDELMLFCGVAIGYEDPSHPINSLRSERFAVEDFATFVD